MQTTTLSELEQAAIGAFRGHFQSEPTVLARAPGRVELLGNHTDYNGGLVLSAAIDRFTVAVGRSLEGRKGTGRIYAQAFGEELVVGSESRPHDHPQGSWKRYAQGVSDTFSGKVRDARGFTKWGSGQDPFPHVDYEALLIGNIPLGTGLSSSASLEAAFTFLLHRLDSEDFAQSRRFETDEQLMDLARDLRGVENECVGVPCGLLDQFSVIMGRAGHALFLDCASEAFERVPLGASPPAIVVCDSKTSRQLAEGMYRIRREECERVLRYFQELQEREELREREEASPRTPLARFWRRWMDRRDPVAEEQALRPRLSALSRVKLAQLEDHWNHLDAVARKRARHVLTENERVMRGVEALHRGDVATLGHLMSLSHRSSRDDFENSSRELDALIEAAEESPGFLGGKLSGAGWAGCTVNLVRAEQAEAFSAAVTEGCLKRTGITPEVHLCHAADGVASASLRG